jgi:hypothetical protein
VIGITISSRTSSLIRNIIHLWSTAKLVKAVAVVVAVAALWL